MKSLRENPEFESKHPRVPSGSNEGGEFVKKNWSPARRAYYERKKFTDEQANEIINRYNTGENSTKLAKEFEVAHTTILRTLHLYGQKIRNLPERHRRLKLNQFAFSKTTPDSAYWAGFLMADGNVRENMVSVHLGVCDVSHLEKFKTFLGSEHKISTSKPKKPFGYIKGIKFVCRETCYIKVRSTQLVSDLARYGIVPGKTKSAAVKELENNPHFWRGMIDGDGSIGRHRGYATLKLIGSESIVNKFFAFVSNIYPKVRARVHFNPSSNIYGILINGRAAVDTIKILYSDPTVTALDRKMKLAQEILTEKK